MYIRYRTSGTASDIPSGGQTRRGGRRVMIRPVSKEKFPLSSAPSPNLPADATFGLKKQELHNRGLNLNRPPH
jgi:hypothetical protein